MKNFYFRSKMLVFIMSGILILTGCSFYPAITPVEAIKQVSMDRDNVAKSDVEVVTEEVHLEMEDLKSNLELEIDFESQPIIDLTTENELETDDNSHQQPNEETEQIVDQDTPQEEKQDNEQQPSPDSNIEHKHIALTFDDGPDLKYTPQVLDILKEKNVKATFFIVGIQINKYPEVVQRMVDEGHLIANHTYHHPNLNSLNKTEILEELDTTDALIESIVGFKPTIVRPPYGAMNNTVKNVIEESGRSVVLWNIDPRDWASTPVKDMYENVMKNAKDEGNILFHSFGGKQIQNTVDLLPSVIDSLTEQGYTYVTAEHFVEKAEASENKAGQ